MAAGATLSIGGVAWAQAAPQPAAAAVAPAPPMVPALEFDRLTLRDAVAKLVKAQPEARVVVDRAIGGATVTLRTEAGPLPQVLERLAAAATKGTLVKATLLPATSAPLDPETVGAYVLAEDSLLRKVRQDGAAAGAASPDAVVMGRALRGAEAKAVVAALKLEPVYLVVNPAAAADPIAKMSKAQEEALVVWASMTPEQREAVADRQFEALLSMEPNSRRALLQQQGQMMQRFMVKVQQMSPEARQSFLNDLTGGLRNGTGAAPPRPPQAP